MRCFLLTVCLWLSFNGIAQKSDTSAGYKVFDLEQKFKDIKFGSSLINVKSKMGLIHEKIAAPEQYTITNKKYLQVWNLNASDGFVIFTKSKLSAVSLIIENSKALKFSSILNYFVEKFGEPVIEKDYYWKGKNLWFVLENNSKYNLTFIYLYSPPLGFPGI